MEEITPDLIARMASRIYNESLKPDGVPTSDAASMLPAAPTGLPGSAGNLPGSFDGSSLTASPPGLSSLPMGAVPPGVPTPSPAAHLLPSPGSALPVSQLPAALPGFTMPSSLPTPATPAAFPSMASFGAPAPAAPTTSAPSSAGASQDGLANFVRNVRQTHFAGRESYLNFSSSQNEPRRPAVTHTPGLSGFAGSRPFDVPAIREDFPILRQKINGKPLVWFDNAATTQKPQSVIDTMARFYEEDYSNIHRGAHTLAARATDAYEKAREKVQMFLGAASPKEIVYVRGTTEGINLVAQTYGKKFLQPGDEIVISMLEHHAQIVPWQMIAKEKGAVLRVIPVNDRGEVMLEEYQKLLGSRTKVVAITQASNSLGTILPVQEMTQMAKRHGARVIIDGAQSVAHIPVNVQQLGCDFFVFSGHKIFGPSGIGAVYIKEELHDVLPPWQGGGNMIRNVTFEETTYSDAPAKFEAGTPSIADAVGLGAALDYVNRLGLPNIAAYERKLLEYATEGLSRINGVRLIGTAPEKVSVISFVLPNRRTEDVGRMLNQEGIAVRSGHHCAQPSLRRFGLESTVRPSMSFYNTTGEIDRLIDAVKRIQLLP